MDELPATQIKNSTLTPIARRHYNLSISSTHSSIIRRPTAMKCHIDLPWKGQGLGYSYAEQADVPILIANCLLMKHNFKVVQELREGVILGRDFASNHDANVEYQSPRSPYPYQMHIRERPVPCQRATKTPCKYRNHQVNLSVVLGMRN